MQRANRAQQDADRQSGVYRTGRAAVKLIVR